MTVAMDSRWPLARQQPKPPEPVEGDGYPHAEMLQAARDRLTIYEAHVAELEAFDALAGIPRKWSDTDETLLELKRRVRACELACQLADVPVPPSEVGGASSAALWLRFFGDYMVAAAVVGLFYFAWRLW